MQPEADVPILLAALSERYEAMRTIRKRIEDTALWILGILVAASGWVVTSPMALARIEKLVLIGALTLALAALRFFYLADLATGFRGQQRVAAHIEATLGLYDVGRFQNSDQPIYPERWSHAGTSRGGGSFIASSNLLIYVAALILISAICLKGNAF